MNFLGSSKAVIDIASLVVAVSESRLQGEKRFHISNSGEVQATGLKFENAASAPIAVRQSRHQLSSCIGVRMLVIMLTVAACFENGLCSPQSRMEIKSSVLAMIAKRPSITQRRHLSAL